MAYLRHALIALITTLMLIGGLPPLAAVGQQVSTANGATDSQAIIDRWNADLSRIDASLDRVGISDFDLRNMRDQVIDIGSNATALAALLAPKVAAVGAQVKELTPVQGADAAVSDAIKSDLAAAQKLYADLIGSQQQAQAIAVHAVATTSQINDRRRSLFTNRLFERSASLVDPMLWSDATAEMPNAVNRASDIVGGWYDIITSRSDRSAMAVVLFVIIGMVVALLPGRRMLLRRLADRQKRSAMPIDGRIRVIAAAVTVTLNTLAPIGILIGGHTILSTLNLTTDRIDQLWWGMISAVTLFSLSFGVSRALLAPSRPDLRLVDIDDAIARRVFRLTAAIAALEGLSVFIERFARIAYTGLPLVVALAGVLSFISAVLIILTVRTLNRHLLPDEEEEDTATAGPMLRSMTFVVAGLMAAAAIVSDLMGYVALGRFITAQIAWIATVVGLFMLVVRLVDELTAAWFRREGMVGSRLIASLGVAPRSLTQVGVLFNGLVRALLIGALVLVIIAPWGVDSTSVFESIRQVFFRLQIGSISISFSAIISGLFVFGIGVIITKALQGWLDTRFLPTTRLDSGLRNSIRTSVGYLGTIAAAAVAFGYSGIDLSSIAIVAGALSVGIGLGLQAIVNNFVSGLILLAERPIRAGDWIAVGSEEGIVKNINVRATEIETFDRATLIVPNSTLITGQVKNFVLRDRSGRAVVPIMVGKSSDPAAVREILLAVAKAHPLVLTYPEPNVLFMAFDKDSLNFQLRVFLADIGQGVQVSSDLRFEALARFRQADILLP